MYILTLLILYIILSQIYLIKFRKFKIKYVDLKIKHDDLKIKYDDLKIKYDSKQWVNGVVTTLVSGMIAGSHRNSGKYKK